MSWSAGQYVKFEEQRTRPVRDLLSDVRHDYRGAAIDLGCGPGNSTQVLREHVPQAGVSGMDSSAEMIEAARERLPNIDFTVGDIVDWSEPGRFDLILANAVLQWLPDHAVLLPSLFSKLAPGGTLAVQMPDNLEGDAHRAMREVAADGPWAKKLAGAVRTRTALAGAGWYYDLLRPVANRVDVWRTTYHHPLSGGPAAVVEWFKGTGLRPFLQPLDSNEREAFLLRYAAIVSRLFPVLADGSVLLPFPRLFIVAVG